MKAKTVSKIGINELNGVNDNMFRKVRDKENSLYIHEEQMNAAKEIIYSLAAKTTRSHHAILVAKMQSGKTGVCNSVTNILSQTRIGIDLGIDKYFFITGMNDNGLKKQTYERVCQQVIGANIDNIYIGKSSKRNLDTNKFFVMKNSDLMKYEGDVNNSIIFIDEAHYGSNDKNILSQFLYKQGIDWKNNRDLLNRNIYVVSVSATPFDELVSDVKECKKIIELKTSKNYVGVSEYNNNNCIQAADKDDITFGGNIISYIAEAKERMNKKNNGVGFIFIRTRQTTPIITDPYVTKFFDVFQMDASTSAIQYNKLNEMMNEIYNKNELNKKIDNFKSDMISSMSKVEVKPLIVIIKGAFRAGITIDRRFKDYIYMVYDYSVKADTTAQALLGRMCGYRSNESISNEMNTIFYINKNSAEMYAIWENDFTNRKAIPCDKMTFNWIGDVEDVDPNAASIIASRSCGNVAINLTDNEIKEIYNNCRVKGKRTNTIKPIFDRLLVKNNLTDTVKYNYIGEALISGKNNYSASTQARRFNSFTEDLAVFKFRPEKIDDFINEKQRDTLTDDDLGTKAVYLVLDATIESDGGRLIIGGNKRLLVYYVVVDKKVYTPNRKGQYKAHKDTSKI